MTETKRVVPASGPYKGMTEMVINGRTIQASGVGYKTENAIRRYARETTRDGR